jgi:hypothetical protein
MAKARAPPGAGTIKHPAAFDMAPDEGTAHVVGQPATDGTETLDG